MKQAVVLPPHPLDPLDLGQIVLAVEQRSRLKNADAPVWFCFPQAAETHAALAERLTGLSILASDSLLAFDEVLFIEVGLAYAANPALPLHRPDRCFSVDQKGGIRPLQRPVDETDDPALADHAFNQLGPRGANAALAHHFFPWSYIYRDVSWGPVNAMGHRIQGDYQALADRDPDHKVIACFGGSAAWGWECLDAQVWTSLLEDRLNARATKVGADLRFTVLNFAGPGHVILNEIFNFVLYCHKITCDVVIHHGGTNDFMNSQLSDGYLLARHDINYQAIMESWAQRLHDRRDRTLAYDPNDDLRISRNPPVQVVRSYVARARQFRSMAEATGARFIWGLQPMLFSKSAVHAKEAEVAHSARDANAREKIPVLFKTLCDNLPLADQACFFNLHEAFGRFGADQNLFWDIVHPNPEGQRQIADLYMERFGDDLFGLTSRSEE
ncbi:MAG: SGNH/GDSL hydrolase family protein [Magnetovibrionaceae bacterium]